MKSKLKSLFSSQIAFWWWLIIGKKTRTLAMMSPKQGRRWAVPTMVERSLAWYSLVLWYRILGTSEHAPVCILGMTVCMCVCGGVGTVYYLFCCCSDSWTRRRLKAHKQRDIGRTTTVRKLWFGHICEGFSWGGDIREEMLVRGR